MLAIDTNILARLLLRDDDDQANRSLAILKANDVFVPCTVLLETAWVLKRAGRMDRHTALASLAAFISLPNVHVETGGHAALAWALEGMDLADALHLVKAKDCDAFISFDRKLAKLAARLDTTPVRLP